MLSLYGLSTNFWYSRVKKNYLPAFTDSKIIKLNIWSVKKEKKKKKQVGIKREKKKKRKEKHLTTERWWELTISKLAQFQNLKNSFCLMQYAAQYYWFKGHWRNKKSPYRHARTQLLNHHQFLSLHIEAKLFYTLCLLWQKISFSFFFFSFNLSSTILLIKYSSVYLLCSKSNHFFVFSFCFFFFSQYKTKQQNQTKSNQIKKKKRKKGMKKKGKKEKYFLWIKKNWWFWGHRWKCVLH